jgi:DNA-binding transcriptional MocR family regulator
VFTLLVKLGDLGVCENLGFWGAREQFYGVGADLVTVPVDGNVLLP